MNMTIANPTGKYQYVSSHWISPVVLTVDIVGTELLEHGDVFSVIQSPYGLCFRKTKYASTITATTPTIINMSVVVNCGNVVVVPVPVPVPVPVLVLGCPSTTVLIMENCSLGQTHKYPLLSRATGVLG